MYSTIKEEQNRIYWWYLKYIRIKTLISNLVRTARFLNKREQKGTHYIFVQKYCFVRKIWISKFLEKLSCHLKIHQTQYLTITGCVLSDITDYPCR